MKTTTSMLALSVFILATGCQSEDRTAKKSDAFAGPVSVLLRSDTTSGRSEAWTFKLTPGSDAILKYSGAQRGGFGRVQQENDVVFRHITPEQIEELRTVLEEEEFFALKPTQGTRIPQHNTTRTMQIICGNRKHTVKLEFLLNDFGKPEVIAESVRAVRVWQHIYRWFEDDDRFGASKELDERLLSAVLLGDPEKAANALLERNFLGGIRLGVPLAFKHLSSEEIREKYPMSQRPLVVLSDETTQVNLTFTKTATYGSLAELTSLRTSYLDSMQELLPETKLESSMLSINGRDWFEVEFETQAIDTTIHNIMRGTIFERKLVFVSANMTAEKKDKWLPQCRRILDSAKIDD